MAQKKRKRSRIIAQFAMLAAVFLLMVNGFLGLLLTNQSGAALRTQISARMLDVSESAAALLDGDALRELTAEDKDTEPYCDESAQRSAAYDFKGRGGLPRG